MNKVTPTIWPQKSMSSRAYLLSLWCILHFSIKLLKPVPELFNVGSSSPTLVQHLTNITEIFDATSTRDRLASQQTQDIDTLKFVFSFETLSINYL